MKHYITDEDINRVSIKNLPYHDENTCKILEVYSKQLLQVARDKNDSNECGILLDSFDLTRSQWFKGIENKVQLTVNIVKIYICIDTYFYIIIRVAVVFLKLI